LLVCRSLRRAAMLPCFEIDEVWRRSPTGAIERVTTLSTNSYLTR
jgi:hypothetical protein